MPGGVLGVALALHVVALSGADVRVAGEFLHLVHGRPVVERVRDRRLSQGMDAHAAAVETVDLDPR